MVMEKFNIKMVRTMRGSSKTIPLFKEMQRSLQLGEKSMKGNFNQENLMEKGD